MLRGDESAFAEFFEANFGALFRFALPRLGGDAHAAEEVVQATLCRAVRKLSTFRGEAALLTWLCTFCRHEISAYLEKEGKRPPMVEWIDDLPEVAAALDSLSAAAGTERAVTRSETARLVQMVLDRLPGRYGDALEWKYIEGLSVAEIADRLGVGAKAARHRPTRCAWRWWATPPRVATDV